MTLSADNPIFKTKQESLKLLFAYGLAFILPAAIYFLRLALGVPLEERLMLILFIFPVLFTALYGGVGPGLTATFFVALSTSYLIPPTDSFAIADDIDLFQWVLLLINGLLVSLMSGSIKSLQRREVEKWQHLLHIESQLRQTQNNYQSIFEQAAVGISILKLNGEWLEMNGKFCEIVGYSKAELLTMSFKDITHPDDLQSDLVLKQQLLNRQIEQFSKEKRFFHKNGHVGWISINVKLMVTENTIPDHFISVITEISDRKRAEAALFKSEMSYRSLFNNMLNGYALCQIIYEDDKPVDFRFLKVNKAFATLTGFQFVVGKTIREILTSFPDTDVDLLQIFGNIARGGEAKQFEYFIESMEKWFFISVFSPKLEQIVIVFDDITERKNAELALQTSEAMTRAILNSVNTHIAVLNTQGEIIAVNQPWLEFAETNHLCSNQPVGHCNIGMDYLSTCQHSICFYSDKDKSSFVGIKAVLEGQIPEFFLEYNYQHPNEQARWYSMSVTPLDGLQGVVIAHNDITERKQAETHLQQLKDDLDATLNALPDLLFEIDEDGYYLSLKATQEDLLVAPASLLLGHTVKEWLPPQAAQTVFDAIAAAKLAGTDYGRTIQLPLVNGEQRCFELSVARKGKIDHPKQQFIVISRDITARQDAETALRQQTQELAERNAELQRFNAAMVGRELFMIELKKEVNALSSELGHPPPYPLAFLDQVAKQTPNEKLL